MVALAQKWDFGPLLEMQACIYGFVRRLVASRLRTE
jgi:hypothetical protein